MVGLSDKTDNVLGTEQAMHIIAIHPEAFAGARRKVPNAEWQFRLAEQRSTSVIARIGTSVSSSIAIQPLATSASMA